VSRNPVRFFQEHKAYERELDVQGGGPIVDRLRADGFCVLPGYAPLDQVEAIRRDVEPILGPLSAGASAPEGVETSSYDDFGTYVLHDVVEVSEAAASYVADRTILDAVADYSDGRARSFGATAELRARPRRNDLVDDLHTDTWAFRFKAMLYLTDVAETSAPLRYVAGSHSGQHWRWQKFVAHYLPHVLPGAGWAHTLRARATARQTGNPHFHPTTIVGPAGTVILFDTRGVHGGSTLVDGRRLIVNHTFYDPAEGQ
jgi:hypothetical protein